VEGGDVHGPGGHVCGERLARHVAHEWVDARALRRW